MAGKPGSLKRFVVALLPLAKEEEWDAGEKMALMPCTAAHGNKPGAAASAESPLEQQQCATEKAMAEGERRSSKRKARRASKGSKPAGTLVPPDGEEMILVPRGKLALSKKLVDKILSLERRELPHVADLLDDDNPNPSEAEKALRKSVRYMDRYNKKRQDKLEECQAMILKLRHAKGYAVVDNHLEMRVAVCKAEGIFLEEDDIPDLIDEGLYLAYN